MSAKTISNTHQNNLKVIAEIYALKNKRLNIMQKYAPKTVAVSFV